MISIPTTPTSLRSNRAFEMSIVGMGDFTPLQSAQSSPRQQNHCASFIIRTDDEDDHTGNEYLLASDEDADDHVQDEKVLRTLYSASTIIQPLSDEENQKTKHENPVADVLPDAVVGQKKRKRTERAVKVESLNKVPKSRGTPTFSSSDDETSIRPFKGKKTKEETKANHRMIERKRTRRLNDLIQKLKSEVNQNGVRCRKDKASVLESAIDCIQSMRKSLDDVQRQLEVANARERFFFMARGLLPAARAAGTEKGTK